MKICSYQNYNAKQKHIKYSFQIENIIARPTSLFLPNQA